MKDTQHTLGPWTVRLHDDKDTAEILDGSGQMAICVLQNARLIAAAPDLLNLMTAATRLDELTGDNLAVYARTFAALARAAIDRATGNQ